MGIASSIAAALALATPGQVWVNLGPADGTQLAPTQQLSADSGRIRKVVAHPTDPNLLYVATAGGGIWKSFDAQTGPHWLWITPGLPTQSTGAFAIDPTTPNNLYVGLGDPFGNGGGSVVTSSDGGASWGTPVQLGSATSVREIVIDPANTGVAIAATDVGLFRSAYAGLGNTWTALKFGNADDCGQAWSLVYTGAHSWVATCQGIDYGSVWRSNDDGISWAQATLPSLEIPDLGRMTLAVSTADSGNPMSAFVYLLAANAAGTDQKDVFLSRDGGASFQSLNMLGSAVCHPTCPTPAYWTVDQADLDVLHGGAWKSQAIAVDPRNHLWVWIAGDNALLGSHDGGQSWSVFADHSPASNNTSVPYVHGGWQHIAISLSTNSPILYAATSGGLFRSTDVFNGAPSSDTNSNCYRGSCIHFDYAPGRGLVSHLARGLAMDIHDANNATLFGGLEDDGGRLRMSGSLSTTFNQMTGGDGAGVGLGISNANAAPLGCRGKWGSLLVGTLPGGIYRSVDCGASFTPAMNGICSPTLFGSSASCGMENASNHFMVMASDQADASGGVFLTAINNSTCSSSASSCTVTPGSSSIYVSSDGAATWAQSKGNLPEAVTSISTNPLSAGMWAATSGHYVYVTKNGGANWIQSAQLPANATSAAFGSADGLTLWATAGSTVLASADSGAHWADVTNNLDPMSLNVIAASPHDPNTWYLGTSSGMFVTHDALGSCSWDRLGSGLPNVAVTAISVTLDSSAIRVATYGRGFWELSGSTGAPAGVLGTGDFDHNQVIDGFDLVRQAAALGTTPANSDYDSNGNLAGTTNAIDSSDWNALVDKLGSRP